MKAAGWPVRLVALALVFNGMVLNGMALAQDDSAASATVPLAPAGEGTRLPELSLREFAALAARNSKDVRYQQLEVVIADQAVRNAWAVFEPQLGISQRRGRTFVGNDTFEKQDYYRLWETRTSATVDFVTPLGTKIKAGYDIRDLKNDKVVVATHQDKNGANVAIVQPLLKDAGWGATMSNINIARADRAIAVEQNRQVLASVILQVSDAFHELQLAQERIRIRTQAAAVANDLAGEVRKLADSGRLAASDILDADTALAQRRAQVELAEQDRIIARNTARDLVFATGVGSATATTRPDIAAEPLMPLALNQELDAASLLEVARARRPEMVAAKTKIDREQRREAYAENQRLPQTDLVAGTNWEGAWTERHQGYYVGVEVKVPLAGGLKSSSELAAAKARKQQAELEREATDTKLITGIESMVGQVRALTRQADIQRESVSNRQSLLSIERRRMAEGRSATRDVLRRQDDLIQQQEAMAERIVALNRAILSLDYLTGTLLDTVGIEVRYAADSAAPGDSDPGTVPAPGAP